MGKLIGAAAAVLLTPVLLISAAAAGFFGGGSTSLAAAGQPPVSAGAVVDIPATWLVLCQRAATAECDGLPWTVLAAIGKVESDHGRSALPGVHSGANPARGAGVISRSLPAAGT